MAGNLVRCTAPFLVIFITLTPEFNRLVMAQSQFFVTTTRASAPDARTICGPGAQLAMPTTATLQSEMAAVLSLAGTTTNLLWLGGKFDQGWKWGDGTPITGYTNWDAGQGRVASGPGQPWMCLRRGNNKWHDCHGRDEVFNCVCQRMSTTPAPTPTSTTMTYTTTTMTTETMTTHTIGSALDEIRSSVITLDARMNGAISRIDTRVDTVNDTTARRLQLLENQVANLTLQLAAQQRITQGLSDSVGAVFTQVATAVSKLPRTPLLSPQNASCASSGCTPAVQSTSNGDIQINAPSSQILFSSTCGMIDACSLVKAVEDVISAFDVSFD